MAKMTSAQEFGAVICDALGLKRMLRLQLDLGPSHASVIATVAVGEYGELANVIRRFDLHPEEKPVGPVADDDGQPNGNDAA